MSERKLGPREQKLRDQREANYLRAEAARKTGDTGRPRWKKQLSAVKANKTRRDRRK